MTEVKKPTATDVVNAEFNLEPIYCVYCDSTEVTFLQYIGDAHCAACGEWQQKEAA